MRPLGRSRPQDLPVSHRRPVLGCRHGTLVSPPSRARCAPARLLPGAQPPGPAAGQLPAGSRTGRSPWLASPAAALSAAPVVRCTSTAALRRNGAGPTSGGPAATGPPTPAAVCVTAPAEVLGLAEVSGLEVILGRFLQILADDRQISHRPRVLPFQLPRPPIPGCWVLPVCLGQHRQRLALLVPTAGAVCVGRWGLCICVRVLPRLSGLALCPRCFRPSGTIGGGGDCD